MIISLVVAAAENNAIGKDNHLLWDLPDDMSFFKNLTWAMPVIMGRKTFESFKKILAGRINIVITRQSNWSEPGVEVASGWEEALQKAFDTDCKEVYIAGGAEIYRMALPHADRIYLTRVHTSIEGDTFFPEFSRQEWRCISAIDHPKDPKHAYDFTFETWERIP